MRLHATSHHFIGQHVDTTAATGRAERALAAAVLLLYPRYLDPVTNLPCTPEILIMRLMAGIMRQNGALVPARRLQGILGRAAARMSKSI